jgi:hypothetical protein
VSKKKCTCVQFRTWGHCSATDTPSAPQAACRDQFGHNTEACTGECSPSSTERDELVNMKDELDALIKAFKDYEQAKSHTPVYVDPRNWQAIHAEKLERAFMAVLRRALAAQGGAPDAR